MGRLNIEKDRIDNFFWDTPDWGKSPLVSYQVFGMSHDAVRESLDDGLGFEELYGQIPDD